MITTEQEARAAVAAKGGRMYRVCNEVARIQWGSDEATWTPATITGASRIFFSLSEPRNGSFLKRAATEWAAARGAAK